MTMMELASKADQVLEAGECFNLRPNVRAHDIQADGEVEITAFKARFAEPGEDPAVTHVWIKGRETWYPASGFVLI